MARELGPALAAGAFLLLVARPLATFITLAPFRFNVRENLYIAWMGLRGAVPIILALFPLMAGVEESFRLFQYTFVIVLLSLLVQTRNDLEAPAMALAPAVGTALAAVRSTRACRLARMSGSGATVFGLYDDCRAAAAAARHLRAVNPSWWIKPTRLR